MAEPFVVVRDRAPLPSALRGGALALGNFDGVHRGHARVLETALGWARARGRPAIALTFDPHPSRYFRPGAPPFALTRLDQKLEAIAGLGLDGAVVVPFDGALAALEPEQFVDQWLVDRLGAAHIVTGEDFHFGRARRGHPELLASLGGTRGFTTAQVSPLLLDDAPISSTRIRQALAKGRLGEAEQLLGRPFVLRGEVIAGDRRGRTIGVPTANMELGDYVRPRFGVYAVRVTLGDGESLRGVANLGVRPMFEPPRLLLETWLLDWSGDLYGQTLDVALVAHLRDEARLAGLDALKAQIAIDRAAAERALDTAGRAPA